jgi:hypothetical protein
MVYLTENRLKTEEVILLKGKDLTSLGLSFCIRYWAMFKNSQESFNRGGSAPRLKATVVKLVPEPELSVNSIKTKLL